MRQIRNFVIDLTPIPATKSAQGIHWPASQATTIQTVKIMMNKASNSVQAGIFIENGSGGHLEGIETVGGLYGLNIGNQQFTMRNVKISGAVVGISQIWNWGWLYQGLTISDCGTAFSMKNQDANNGNALLVSSVTIIDSDITNCPTFVDMVSRAFPITLRYTYVARLGHRIHSPLAPDNSSWRTSISITSPLLLKARAELSSMVEP
jgi:glucan 1,3-beta-glucosidase